jgi:hypothetical protein
MAAVRVHAEGLAIYLRMVLIPTRVPPVVNHLIDRAESIVGY